MKKLSIFLVTLSMLIISLFSLSACANTDRYELTYISGLGVSTDAYEYNYIDFNFDNNTYTLENKAKVNGIVTKQTGTFIVDQFGGVTISNDAIPSQNYLLYRGELLSFSGDYTKFSASATISGIEVVMIYTKK